MSEFDEQAGWSGKRWHGAYKHIDAVCDAAHADGLESFLIDYVTEEE